MNIKEQLQQFQNVAKSTEKLIYAKKIMDLKEPINELISSGINPMCILILIN